MNTPYRSLQSSLRMLTVAAVSVSVLAAGCSETVPVVTDPHHPVDLQGHPVTPQEFVRLYCQDKQMHPTCSAVVVAARSDSTKGAIPAGW